MVEEYIQKIYEELLKEEQNSAKRISDLQIHLKETQAMIHLLEETNDPNYESFTPRKVNSRNKQKIDELHAEMKELEEAIQQETDYHTQQMERVEEAAKVLRQAKADVACRCDRNTLEEERYHTSLLETQENERQRISRELHDSTVQNLTAMVHMAELCSKLVDMDPIRCKLELNKMIKNLREIIDDTRKMIYNLRPMSFDDIGLDITIERTLDKLEATGTKKIHFVVEGTPYQLKPIIGITLLRIIQEACSNAICHANPTLIHVLLRYEQGGITVIVEDDGTGFDVHILDERPRDDNSGFGMSMMKERVYLLSGSIQIDSKIGVGTKIIVKVPISNKEEFYMAVKVMITDDHSLIREGLKQLLELEGDFQVIAEACDGIDCMEKLKEQIPDVLLLDINMPRMNGLEVLQNIKDEKIDVKILVLTVHNEVEYLLKAVDIGINGYLLKDSESSELKKAILSVVDGEDYIQPSLIPVLNAKMIDRDMDSEKIEKLTKRELEVLKLLAVGMYNKGVADELHISERTVKNHVSSIFKKIDVSDRTQAAVFAIRNNLISIH